MAGAAWLGQFLSNYPAQAQGQETFKGRLAPVPLDAKTRPDVAGFGSATAVLAGTKLTVSGNFSEFKSPATVARVHQSRITGIRGPALFDLTVTKGMSGTISGSFDLTSQQADALRKGLFYVQIHTEKAPDGNVWGWLFK
jgi:hypothetical protein